MVSGKQAYYLLPEAAGGAMLLASGFAQLARRGRHAPRIAGGWMLATAIVAGALALWQLPRRVAQGHIDSVWYIDLAGASPWFVPFGIALGLLFLVRMRDDGAAVRCFAGASIATVALVYALFAQTLWPRFDLRPAAQRVAQLEAAGVPVAHLDIYQNQFRFLGRLQQPLTAFLPHEGAEWAAAHPQGRVIHYVTTLGVDDIRHAELVQPFRSSWLLIERADSWSARKRGEPAPLPETPPQLYPPDYWPYRALQAEPPRVD